jgi:hypothetical protein
MLEKNATHMYEWRKPIIVVVGLFVVIVVVQYQQLLVTIEPHFIKLVQNFVSIFFLQKCIKNNEYTCFKENLGNFNFDTSFMSLKTSAKKFKKLVSL